MRTTTYDGRHPPQLQPTVTVRLPDAAPAATIAKRGLVIGMALSAVCWASIATAVWLWIGH